MVPAIFRPGEPTAVEMEVTHGCSQYRLDFDADQGSATRVLLLEFYYYQCGATTRIPLLTNFKELRYIPVTMTAKCMKVS